MPVRPPATSIFPYEVMMMRTKTYVTMMAVLLTAVVLVSVPLTESDADDLAIFGQPYIYDISGMDYLVIEFNQPIQGQFISAIESDEGTIRTSCPQYFAEPMDKMAIPLDGVVLIDGGYTLTLVGDILFTGHFTMSDMGSNLFIEVNDPSRGSVTCNFTEGVVQPGQTVILMVTPNKGFEVGSVTVNGDGVQGLNGVYSFNMPQTADVYVSFNPIGTPSTEDGSDSTIYMIIATVILIGLVAVVVIKKLR